MILEFEQPSAEPAGRETLGSIASLLSASAEPDPDALQAAVERVLAESADDDPEIESGFAMLAAQYAPRSDFFVQFIVDYFGWRTAQVTEPQLRGAIGFCVQRARDLDYWDSLLETPSLRRAVRELQSAPRDTRFKRMLSPGLLNDMQTVLSDIYCSHPSLQHAFPKGALEAWIEQFDYKSSPHWNLSTDVSPLSRLPRASAARAYAPRPSGTR